MRLDTSSMSSCLTPDKNNQWTLFIYVSYPTVSTTEPELSPQHSYLQNHRFSRSAVELSFGDCSSFDVESTSVAAAPSSSLLPNEAASSSLVTSSSALAVALPSTSCAPSAANSVSDTSSCCGHGQSTSNRKPSPIRAYLTPPLMRKRNRQAASVSLVGGGSEDVLSTSLPNRAKPPGFFSLLKVLLNFSLVIPSINRAFPICYSTFRQSKFDRSSRISKNPVSGTCSGPGSLTQVSGSPQKSIRKHQQKQHNVGADLTDDVSRSLASIAATINAADHQHQSAAITAQ